MTVTIKHFHLFLTDRDLFIKDGGLFKIQNLGNPVLFWVVLCMR